MLLAEVMSITETDLWEICRKALIAVADLPLDPILFDYRYETSGSKQIDSGIVSATTVVRTELALRKTGCSLQEGEKAYNLRKSRDTGRASLGHMAGQTVVFRPVSQRFPVVYQRRTTILPGHQPGVPGTPGCPGSFQKFYAISSCLPFLLPISSKAKILGV